MSILRKRGKEKLSFKIMNRRVTNKEFEYFKRLFLECLRENSDIEKQLDSYYNRIQVYFLYKRADLNVEKTLREFFKDPNPYLPPPSKPVFAISKKGSGCIGFFLEDLRGYVEERKYIQNVEAYHKNVVFEELCHLVEQKGSYTVYIYPESGLTLYNLYGRTSRSELGNEIIEELYQVRGHYEVWLMMIEAYPKEWVERYWKYFKKDPVAYEQEYEKWKRNVPIEIVYGRLITDTLRTIIVLCVAKKIPKEKLLNKQKKLLDILTKTAKLNIETKKSLIERDMGSGALSLIDSLDESIFKTGDIFFSVVLDLWKSLHLV